MIIGSTPVLLFKMFRNFSSFILNKHVTVVSCYVMDDFFFVYNWML